MVGIVGPTATGKSDLAVQVAQQVAGEVVNADAAQLYRGMDIGTAKLTPTQRRGIPHHQLDVLNVTDEASVAAYQIAARADIDDILARGVVPILVGGSGLYVRAALDVLDIPPTDPLVRAALEVEGDRLGTTAMYQRLAKVDAEAAAAIEPNNRRRIIRALEVIELTGRSFSARMPHREYRRPSYVLGLLPPRTVTDVRIDARVHRMWADGLVTEVGGLLDRGLRSGKTASRAVGYAQAVAEIDGTMTPGEAIEETQRLTRRLARRQESWFRADARIDWVDPDREDALARVLHRVAECE
ncbi:MAG: tRNA (adenosine(37)-N6)-dimethylallyltransferase MiaA [Nostocoides sp.]